MANIIQTFPKGTGSGGGHTILDTDGTAVVQESNLQFTGLSVTDDSTNGITEVAGEGLNSDSIDDIASASSVVPAVIIGDANNYSTNEKIIGKWIDGKPIYQKAIFTTESLTADTWLITNESGANIDNVFESYYIRINSGTGVVPLCTPIGVSLDPTSLKLRIMAFQQIGNPNDKGAYIVYRYTKTT